MRSDRLRRLLCWVIQLYIRFVYRTNRWTIEGGEIPRELRDAGQAFILAFWHGRLLMIPMAWQRLAPMHMLISAHRDGRIIADAVTYFGVESIAGSTRRGGSSALRLMLDNLIDNAIKYSTTTRAITVSAAVQPPMVVVSVRDRGVGIRSGELAGYVEMRDNTLVQAQGQLDELASQLSRALSDLTTNGAPVTVGSQSGFTVDVSNLFNDSQRWYIGTPDRLQQHIMNGTTITVGMNGRF